MEAILCSNVIVGGLVLSFDVALFTTEEVLRSAAFVYPSSQARINDSGDATSNVVAKALLTRLIDRGVESLTSSDCADSATLGR